MRQLADRVVWILRNLEKSSRPRPSLIFIIRDGLSEGQFAMACKEELQVIFFNLVLVILFIFLGNSCWM